MNLTDTIDTMSNDLYLRLKCAAETGKWPEGIVVEQEQRDVALQLIMAFQAKHLNSDQMLTVGSDGELVNKTKRELKEQFSSTNKDKPITPCAKPTDSSAKSDIAHFTHL